MIEPHLASLAELINQTPAHKWAQTALTTEGVAPLIQSAHILGIAVVMGSIVLIDLRVLGLAARSQTPSEMTRRLTPWLWTALVVLLVSGTVMLVLRPTRYFGNPFFLWKMALLLGAAGLALAQSRLYPRIPAGVSPASWPMKAMAAGSLLLWVGVVICGRWIAYYFAR